MHQATDYIAQRAARTAAAKAMQAAFPHLIATGGKVDDVQCAAKNIRIELKRAFPSTKFSVKTSRYSGGNSLRINWTDGPTAGQVAEITGRYKAGSFDGMTDCYDYQQGAWTDAFGSACYVFNDRDTSDAALRAAIRTVMTKYAGNCAERGISAVDIADYRAGRLYEVDMMDSGGNGHWSLQAIICREADRRTWALSKAPKSLPMHEDDAVAA